MMNHPQYSVILPVCHGGKFLADALTSLKAVNPPGAGFEVIITGKIEKMKNSNISYFSEPDWRIVECGGNRSDMLNAACAVARGNIWVFSDDDCIFPLDWLVQVEKSIQENPAASILGGADVLIPGASGFDVALDVALNSWIGTGGTRSDKDIKAGGYYPKLWNMTVTADAAKRAALDYPKSAWIFDPALSVHEDVDLAERIKNLGGQVVYAPHVAVLHSRDTTFIDFLRRNMDMARVCRQKGIHRWPHLFLAAAIIGAPVLLALSLVASASKILFIVYGLYIAVVGLIGLKGAVLKKHAVLIILIPGLIILLHFARAVGYVSAPKLYHGG